MSNHKIADHYDEIYSHNEDAFAGDPLPLVERLLEYVQKGTVLELGAGRGRNALFLAAKGFDVTATDISPVAVAGMIKKATEEGILLNAHVLDIGSESIVGYYDIIICTFTLHHLKREDSLEAIRAMQEHTNSSGFNIITVFTKDGDFYRNNTETLNFFLEGKAELEGLYSGWNMLKSFEKGGHARTLNEANTPMQNVFAGLLAQKKAE
jgi:tellurite methyltransferase